MIISQGRDYSIYGMNLECNGGKAKMAYGNSTNGNVAITGTTDIYDGWHHVVCTYDSAIGGKLYVDGVLEGSGAISNPDYTYAYDALVIGKMAYAYTSTTNYFPFNGKIDDVRVYATALSADEVNSLYTEKGSIDNAGNLYINELNMTTSHVILDELTAYPYDNTYCSLFTTTIGDEYKDISDFVEDDDTLGNTVVTADIYCSSAEYYPTSCEYTRENNTKGFKTNFLTANGS